MLALGLDGALTKGVEAVLESLSALLAFLLYSFPVDDDLHSCEAASIPYLIKTLGKSAMEARKM